MLYLIPDEPRDELQALPDGVARRSESDHLHVRLVHRPPRLHHGHHLCLGAVSPSDPLVGEFNLSDQNQCHRQDTALQELRPVQGILERGGHWVLDERRLQPRPFLSPLHGVGRDHIAVCIRFIESY